MKGNRKNSKQELAYIPAITCAYVRRKYSWKLKFFFPFNFGLLAACVSLVVDGWVRGARVACIKVKENQRDIQGIENKSNLGKGVIKY